MPLPIYPRFVALCGNPKSGKSEVQNILAEEFGYVPVDDGEPLRNFAMNELGLTRDQVYTQAGKAECSEILGLAWQHRDILGSLGNHLEDMFGESILPYIAIRKTVPTGRYSFGSVRKRQGHFYNMDGVTIEIVRPGAGPSPYEFDKYDPAAVKATILNDGSLADLRTAVVETVERLSK